MISGRYVNSKDGGSVCPPLRPPPDSDQVHVFSIRETHLSRNVSLASGLPVDQVSHGVRGAVPRPGSESQTGRDSPSRCRQQEAVVTQTRMRCRTTGHLQCSELAPLKSPETAVSFTLASNGRRLCNKKKMATSAGHFSEGQWRFSK